MLNTTVLGKIFAEAVTHASKGGDTILEAVGKAFGHFVLTCVQPKVQPQAATPAPAVKPPGQWFKSKTGSTYVVDDILVDAYKTGKLVPLVIKKNFAINLDEIDQDKIVSSRILKKLIAEGSIVQTTKEEADALDAKGNELSEWGVKTTPLSGRFPGQSVADAVFGDKVQQPDTKSKKKGLTVLDDNDLDGFVQTLRDKLESKTVRNVERIDDPVEVAIVDGETVKNLMKCVNGPNRTYTPRVPTIQELVDEAMAGADKAVADKKVKTAKQPAKRKPGRPNGSKTKKAKGTRNAKG